MNELIIGSTNCGTVIGCKRAPKAQKVILTALDGTAYAQNIGEAIWKYKVSVFCPTFEAREAVDNACNNGGVVAVYKDGTPFVEGYIEEATIPWKEWIDEHGVCTFTLVKK